MGKRKEPHKSLKRRAHPNKEQDYDKYIHED